MHIEGAAEIRVRLDRGQLHPGATRGSSVAAVIAEGGGRRP
jgi:hypothetical protein